MEQGVYNTSKKYSNNLLDVPEVYDDIFLQRPILFQVTLLYSFFTPDSDSLCYCALGSSFSSYLITTKQNSPLTLTTSPKPFQFSYPSIHLYPGGSRSKETIYIPEDPGLNTAISLFLPNDVTVGGGHSGGGEVATPVEAKSSTP